MDSTGKVIVWVLGILTAREIIIRWLIVAEEKIKLMKNREITDISKEWDSEL